MPHFGESAILSLVSLLDKFNGIDLWHAVQRVFPYKLLVVSSY